MTMSESALAVARDRYFFDDETTWEQCAERVGDYVADVEKDKNYYSEQFADVIKNMDFLPGGRILRNARRNSGSMFNCYCLPIEDSIEEIGQFMKDALILWSEGGGVGTNLSFLRPKGATIKGKGGTSSGPVSFLSAADSIASTIESGGSRRAAGLGCMLVEHPDVLDFMDAKTIQGDLSYFNISVIATEAFLEAVESNDNWTFKFARQDYNTMPAVNIWDKIVDNMLKYAEPGLLHWENMTSNNSYYFQQIQSVNPCGEAPLGAYNVCNLGSLVLPNFITGNVNTNWKKLERTIKLAVRFLDDVIECNKYVLKEIDINAHHGRRIGLGVMGLAEYLFAKKLRYGSKKAIYEVERLMRFIRDVAYETSIELAIEKGAFPKFDPVAYGKAHFIRTLPASLRMKIKEHGTRNVTLLAMAPTGTISLVSEVSSGIEPLFKKAYRRNDRIGDRMYIHPLYKDMLKEDQVPEWFVDADDLSPEDHLEVQVAVQKYVDGSVSKTINMPSDTTKDRLSKLLLEYVHDLKGVTIYVDGSRDNQVLNKVSEEDAKKHIEESSTKVDDDLVACATGNCEI